MYHRRFRGTNMAERQRDFRREMHPYDKIGGRCSFPEALYKLVDDPSTDSVISWSQSGNSFVVWNESEFCKGVLLGIRHFVVFVKWLNRHAFRKVEESGHQLEWAHASFVKGKPELAKPEHFVITRPPPVDLEEKKKWFKKRAAELVLMKKKREAKKERRDKKELVKRFEQSLTL